MIDDDPAKYDLPAWKLIIMLIINCILLYMAIQSLRNDTHTPVYPGTAGIERSAVGNK
ncbi:hypothetical protein [Hyphomonas adhaerens]|uniref:hypothetical protein n=1 Tax=Hyphomonas adhaerens TaxID=81029 RepID=UPI0012EBD27C|nr:hypothetical protein [Hyphomonas adhaerens]